MMKSRKHSFPIHVILLSLTLAVGSMAPLTGCTAMNELDDLMGGGGSHSYSGSLKRVAVIDDSKTSRRAVLGRLPGHRLAVYEYPSAKAFLSDFKDKGFSLIICDMVLEEGTTGADVLKEVRRHSSRPIPFVLVSAYETEDEMRPLLDAGATRVLSKRTLDDLRAIVNEIFGFHDATDSNR